MHCAYVHQAKSAALNGKELLLQPDGTPPSMPVPASVPGTTVRAPALSVSFAVFQ
jgi:hypothetical protein